MQPTSRHPISSEPARTPVTSNGAAAEPSVVEGKRGKYWSLDSWKKKKALQLPEYPNEEELQSVLGIIEGYPPLVLAGEARNLEEKIAQAAMGNAFLLQGGDCAESFKEFNANKIRDTFRILLQMSVFFW